MDSYLPEDLSFKRVVGVGMNQEEMTANPSLTESVVQNLNSKVSERVCMLALALVLLYLLVFFGEGNPSADVQGDFFAPGFAGLAHTLQERMHLE